MLSHIQLIGTNGKVISGTRKRNLEGRAGHSIPIQQYSLEGKWIKTWNSAKEAAEAFGTTGSAIRLAANRAKPTVGYYWRYLW